MKRKFGEEYAICPPTYLMPEDHARLSTEREADPKALWILKPVASCCGRGIKMISRTDSVPKKTYTHLPHLS
jgi:tubulin polyglutamylase TTLL4